MVPQLDTFEALFAKAAEIAAANSVDVREVLDRYFHFVALNTPPAVAPFTVIPGKQHVALDVTDLED